MGKLEQSYLLNILFPLFSFIQTDFLNNIDINILRVDLLTSVKYTCEGLRISWHCNHLLWKIFIHTKCYIKLSVRKNVKNVCWLFLSFKKDISIIGLSIMGIVSSSQIVWELYTKYLNFWSQWTIGWNGWIVSLEHGAQFLKFSLVIKKLVIFSRLSSKLCLDRLYKSYCLFRNLLSFLCFFLYCIARFMHLSLDGVL